MKNIDKLSELLGYKFKNKALLIESLTHPSIEKKSNYERLEFLGDRVLGLVIAREIYKLNPSDSEGNLAKKFSHLVCKDTLVKIANKINLDDYLITADIIKKTPINSIKANSLEALIAAIFLDSDFTVIANLIKNLWAEHIKKIDLNDHDPKSKLQEWSLKEKNKLPIYKILKKDGPEHEPKFTIKVETDENFYSIGVGKNKQDAEVKAAGKLLKKIELKK